MTSAGIVHAAPWPAGAARRAVGAPGPAGAPGPVAAAPWPAGAATSGTEEAVGDVAAMVG